MFLQPCSYSLIDAKFSRRSNYSFSTLTYPRDKNTLYYWSRINQDTNRYVQRVRRKIDQVDYLKVYEIHKDGYPHVHILFIFSNLQYPSNNTRWLPSDVFQKLKSLWTQGLSDHQSPISSSDHSVLNYVLKYALKSQSASHLWSNILGLNTEVRSSDTNDLGYPIKREKYASYKEILVRDSEKLTYCTLKTKKIKLTSWSRNFVSAYLKSKHS